MDETAAVNSRLWRVLFYKEPGEESKFLLKFSCVVQIQFAIVCKAIYVIYQEHVYPERNISSVK